MMYRYTDKDLDLLGRIMRAEAIGEGPAGMSKVGNVVANRIKATCFVFYDLRTLNDVIYQRNAFASVNSPLYTGRATEKEKKLAQRALTGSKYYPATNALWFYAPGPGNACRPTWFEQRHAGRYKNHCFYEPDPGVCIEIH